MLFLGFEIDNINFFFIEIEVDVDVGGYDEKVVFFILIYQFVILVNFLVIKVGGGFI